MKRALVVAAHPDDEVLGCGGTIARLADGGWEVAILILAEGSTSRSPQRDRSVAAAELSELARSARAAAKVLGAVSVELEDFPDNRMDSVDLLDVVKRIEQTLADFQPERVFTHHSGDVNVDHAVVHRATSAACRAVPGSCVRELAFFEVLSSTEWQPSGGAHPFVPNLFVDIGGTLSRKVVALQAYAAEMRAFPHPRSLEAVEHLARLRGATAGCSAAEAFHIGRRVE